MDYKLLVLFLVFLFTPVKSTINVCVPLNITGNDVSDTDILKEFVEKLDEKNDTLYVEHINVNLSHPAVHLKGSLDKLYIRNLTNFNVCFLDVNLTDSAETSKFDLFNLTFDEISFEGLYDFKGDLGELFNVFGKGDFWTRMNNFSIKMNLSNLHITDDEACALLNLDINLMKQSNHFNRLMEDSELEELFNKIFEKIVPESMQIIWKEWKGMYDECLEDVINEVIKYIMQTIFPKPPPLLWQLFHAKDLDTFGPYCYNSKDFKPINLIAESLQVLQGFKDVIPKSCKANNKLNF